ncbi:MAG: transcriptional regulator [Acidimicrobiia bacterium]|nr:transcriptional regulator [Acidimicrobiia bacterium]
MSGDEHPLWQTLRPVADAVGGDLLPPEEQTPGDIPLEFDGETVGVLRLWGLDGALGRLIETVERELGGSLAELSRTDKQVAVRLLNERSAFLLRKGVEDVATAMGVSRITIYNYLNAMEQAAG